MSPIKKVVGGPGITAGGNVSFGDGSGQIAIGKYIQYFANFRFIMNNIPR